MFTPRAAAWTLAVLYVAAMVAALFAVGGRGAAPWTKRADAAWAAARDLAPPEQLDSADLVAPGDTAARKLPARATLVGRHLVHVRRKGAPVTAVDVAPFSVGTPRPRTVRFVLAARADQSPALALARPGEALSPCTASPATPPVWSCAGGPFTVVALHRTAKGDSVWAVLESPDAELAARFSGATDRMLVRRQ